MFSCLLSIKSEAKARAQALSALHCTSDVEELEESNSKQNSHKQHLRCNNTEKPSSFDCLSCALHLERSISEKKCNTQHTKDESSEGKHSSLHSSSQKSDLQEQQESQKVKQQITSLLSYVLQQEENQQLESFFSSCANEQSEHVDNDCQKTEMNAREELNALYNNLPLLYALSIRCNGNLTSRQTLSKESDQAKSREQHQNNKKEVQEEQKEQDDLSFQYQCEFEALFANWFNSLFSSQQQEHTQLSSREVDYLRKHFPNTFGVLLTPTWLRRKQNRIDNNSMINSNSNNYYTHNSQSYHEDDVDVDDSAKKNNHNSQYKCGITLDGNHKDNAVAHDKRSHPSSCCCCCKESLNSLRLITPYTALHTNRQIDSQHEPNVIDVDDEKPEEAKEEEKITKNIDQRAPEIASHTYKDNEAIKEINNNNTNTNNNNSKAKNSFSFNVTSDKINVNNGQTIRARSPPPLFPRQDRNEESVNTSINNTTHAQNYEFDKHGKGNTNNSNSNNKASGRIKDNNTAESTMTSFFNTNTTTTTNNNTNSAADKHVKQKTLEDFSIYNNGDSKEIGNRRLLETSHTTSSIQSSNTISNAQNKKTPLFSSLARMQEEEQQKSYFSFTSNAHITAPQLQKGKALNSGGASSANNSQDSLSERSKDFVTAGAQLLADVKNGRAGALASALAKTHAPALGLRRPGFQPPFHNGNQNNNTSCINHYNSSSNEYYNDDKAAHTCSVPISKVLSSVVSGSSDTSSNNKGKRQRAVDNTTTTNNKNNGGTAMAESDEGNGENDYPASLLLPDGSVPPLLLPLDASLVRQVAYEILENNNSNSNNNKSKIGWDDIAGLQHAKRTIEEAIIWPLKRPDLFTGLRDPPRGLLLFGPPGTGKTMIARAIAHRANCTFINISSSSIMSKWIGDGEKLVRCVFAVAAVKQPSVVFVDEIDSLLSTRMEGETDAVRRVKTEFLVQLDGVATDRQDRVLLIGATNRPDDLDEAARRRLEKRLYIPLPDHDARCELITRLLYTLERDYYAANPTHETSSKEDEEQERQHCKKDKDKEEEEEEEEKEKKKDEHMNISTLYCNDRSSGSNIMEKDEKKCWFECDVVQETSKVKVHTLSVQDIALLAKWTAGFSGADLKQLCREAAMGPLREMTMVQLDAISAHDLRPINLKDFKLALKRMKPSVSSKEVARYVQWNALFGSFSQIYEDEDDDEDKDENDNNTEKDIDDNDVMDEQQLKSNNSSSINNSWNGEAGKLQAIDHHNDNNNSYRRVDSKDDRHTSQVLGVHDMLAAEE